MRIAIPAEIKNHEYRVAITPAGVHALTERGHEVIVQSGAGVGSAIDDDAFAAAGASIAPDADATWAAGELLLKVKEPVAAEYQYLRDDQALFTYLHLAADRPLTEKLLAARATAIAYETVQHADRSLPLLAPMSQVAGRLAPQVGAAALLKATGGRGVLLSGIPGTAPGHIVVIGAGVAGANAVAVAVGLGARVTVLDTDLRRLAELDARYAGRITTMASSPYAVEHAVIDADLVIGAVLLPGGRAPIVVTDEMVRRMRPGSVLVDIAVDQGGCFEGTRATTHDEPTYRVHESVFYCVANMPGAAPATSTNGLTNATLPYVVALADRGVEAALQADDSLAAGLNTADGFIRNASVSAALGYQLA